VELVLVSRSCYKTDDSDGLHLNARGNKPVFDECMRVIRSEVSSPDPDKMSHSGHSITERPLTIKLRP